jgi:hypothetical protein
MPETGFVDISKSQRRPTIPEGGKFGNGARQAGAKRQMARIRGRRDLRVRS